MSLIHSYHKSNNYAEALCINLSRLMFVQAPTTLIRANRKSIIVLDQIETLIKISVCNPQAKMSYYEDEELTGTM